MSGVGGSSRKRISFVDPVSFTPHFSWENAKSVNRLSGSKPDLGAAPTPAARLRPYVGSRLHCEDISLCDIAGKVETPAYVYSQAAIGDAYEELDGGLGTVSHT